MISVLPPGLCTLSASWMEGSDDSCLSLKSKCTSTTGPMIWEMCPVTADIYFFTAGTPVRYTISKVTKKIPICRIFDLSATIDSENSPAGRKKFPFPLVSGQREHFADNYRTFKRKVAERRRWARTGCWALRTRPKEALRTRSRRRPGCSPDWTITVSLPLKTCI